MEMFFRSEECLDSFQNWAKILEIKSAEINAALN